MGSHAQEWGSRILLSNCVAHQADSWQQPGLFPARGLLLLLLDWVAAVGRHRLLIVVNQCSWLCGVLTLCLPKKSSDPVLAQKELMQVPLGRTLTFGGQEVAEYHHPTVAIGKGLRVPASTGCGLLDTKQGSLLLCSGAFSCWTLVDLPSWCMDCDVCWSLCNLTGLDQWRRILQ